jgi:hypothetical protein
MKGIMHKHLYVTPKGDGQRRLAKRTVLENCMVLRKEFRDERPTAAKPFGSRVC